MSDRPDVLVDAVEPALRALGIDLYDLELAGKGGTRVLRVTIDRQGGVDLDAITAATEALSPVLDHDPAVAALLKGAYTLEVTSPGLERTLRTPVHFQRAIGSKVSVKTGTGPSATRQRGTLVAAGEDGFDLQIESGDAVHIAYGDVVQARTVFEWGNESAGRGRKKQKVAS